MTLLTVKHLFIKDSWTNQTIVNGLSFTVDKGEVLGIIGESGSGKSVTCKALVGLNPKRLSVEGKVTFNNVQMLTLSEMQLKKHRGKDIAMVMQQGSRAFDPSSTVGKQLIETMKVHTQLSIQEIEATLIEYMDYGIKQSQTDIKVIPYMLSGNITAYDDCFSFGIKPKLIIADEPTTALDTITQYDVLQAFKDIKQHFDCAMIFISHDLTVINHIADRVVVMRNGQLIEEGAREGTIPTTTTLYSIFIIHTKKLMIILNLY
ncbi:ABC transporter ATP-binding protein [Staphylococcus xylosus]|uniref:ABC transporter ATP-binding protein n=1 Tax=Staphylococcus xylosus TaxID=1288 RepID=A0A939NBS4_STAXY|nr:ABC transporter ATP-binding protein [Staphylococcus xylosus]